MWREFTRIVEAEVDAEVAREVWEGLPERVRKFFETESATRRGFRKLLEKQAAEIAAVDDELGEYKSRDLL